MRQNAFVDESTGITQIKEWHRRFKNGRTFVDSDPRSSRPLLTTTPKNIERVRLAIEDDRRLTVRELENDLGIPKTTVWEILNKILGMTRVCAKFIPKLLTTEQLNNNLHSGSIQTSHGRKKHVKVGAMSS